MTTIPTRRFAAGVVSLTTLAMIAASASAATATPHDQASDDRRVVDALDRRAHPLGDRGWAALVRMTHGADVVGVGEATHSSTEFMATKRRIFEYLVEHRGFRTFAQEFS